QSTHTATPLSTAGASGHAFVRRQQQSQHCRSSVLGEPHHRGATAIVYALLSLANLLRLRIINRIHYQLPLQSNLNPHPTGRWTGQSTLASIFTVLSA